MSEKSVNVNFIIFTFIINGSLDIGGWYKDIWLKKVSLRAFVNARKIQADNNIDSEDNGLRYMLMQN